MKAKTKAAKIARLKRQVDREKAQPGGAYSHVAAAILDEIDVLEKSPDSPLTLVDFTAEERQQLHQAILTAWAAIADEIDIAFCDEDGENSKLTLAIAVECTLDADRLMTFARKPEEFRPLYEKFNSLSFGSQNRFAKSVLKGHV